MADERDRRAASRGGVDRDAEPIGTNASQGAPPPNTDRNTGSVPAGGGDAALPDPDYGMNPNVTGPGYASAGRGSETLADATGQRRRPLEGEGLTAMSERDAPRTGQARGGDMTSNANSYEDTLHGMGEAGVRGTMPQGKDAPGMATNRAADPRPGVDPADESTFEEGQQYAESDRA
jgi:hypothetical protein